MPYINVNQVDRTLASSVKRQVETLVRSTPARNTETPDFFEYVIDVENSLFSGSFSNIYLAHHRASPEQPLVARVYEPTARIDARRSIYMKVLKHIGKNSQWCISTWDIFFDDAGRVVIFQEYCIYGNLRDFLKVNRVYVPETQMGQWAVQLYLGMDYLGGCGIAHRSISPKHVLLTTAAADAERTIVKLSSFRDSVLYYDHIIGTVKALIGGGGRALNTGAHFQAPETFEEGRTFNPVAADVWSYGATLFFANTRTYPVRYGTMGEAARNEQAVELAGPRIEQALAGARNLTPAAKSWLAGILKASPQERTPFEAIARDQWFQRTEGAGGVVAAVQQQQQQQPVLQKVNTGQVQKENPPPPPPPPPPPAPVENAPSLQLQQQPSMQSQASQQSVSQTSQFGATPAASMQSFNSPSRALMTQEPSEQSLRDQPPPPPPPPQKKQPPGAPPGNRRPPPSV